MEKLYDSELKVMEPLWADGPLSAGALAKRLGASCGWNRNTTYTVIKKCVAKGAIQRTEPNFLCHPLLPKTEVQKAETDELIGKLFDGSADKLFSALLGRKKLTAEQLTALKEIVGDLDEVEP